MKNSILTQILEQDARARCECCPPWNLILLALVIITVNSIALVKPERARHVEAMLIQMAQTGQIVGKVRYGMLYKCLSFGIKCCT